MDDALVAILSTIETVLLSAALAPGMSLSSSDARIAFNAHSGASIASDGLASRRVMFLPIRLEGRLCTLCHGLLESSLC
jgi:hypothetical protein